MVSILKSCVEEMAHVVFGYLKVRKIGFTFTSVHEHQHTSSFSSLHETLHVLIQSRINHSDKNITFMW